MSTVFRPLLFATVGLQILTAPQLNVFAWTPTIVELRQESDQDPEAAQLIAQTAVTAQNNEDYALAARQWEKLLTEFPNSSLVGKAHFNAGVCYVQSQDYKNAADHLSKALNKLDADEVTQLPQAYLYLGFSQFRLGQALSRETGEASQQEANTLLTTSTRTFAKLLEKFPNFVDADQACFFQGNAFEDLRRLEDAEKSYEKMFGYPKQTFKFDGLFAIGNVNEQLGNFTRAIEYYDQFRKEADAADGNPLLEEVNFRTAKTRMRLAAADVGRGDRSASQDNYQRAAKLLETIASQEIESAAKDRQPIIDESQFQLAFCKAQLGQYQAAAEIYEQVAARVDSPFRVQSLIYAGSSFARAGKMDEAITVLQSALDSDSVFSIEAAAALSNLYLKQKEFAKAYEIADAWINKTSEHRLLPSLMLDRADAVYQMSDRRAESPEMFLELADKYPDHELAATATYNAAYALLELNQLKQAVEIADRFSEKFADNSFLPDSMEIKADALLLDDQPLESEKVFAQLVSRFPDNEKTPRWILRAGLSSYLQKKYQETIEWLSPKLSLLKQPTQLAEAYHWIGSSHFNEGQFADAAQALQKSVDADANWRRSDETLLTLTRAHLNLDSDTQAKQIADRMIDDHPDSPLTGEVLYYLGENAYDNREYAEAFESFKAVMDRFADSRLVPYSIYNAAWSLLEQKKFEDSEILFSRLISEFPDHELAQKAKLGRGATRRKTGKMEESIADLKASLKDNPAGPSKFNALYELGLAQIEQKKWQEAITTFDQLLNEDTDSPRADRYHYELAWAHQSLDQSGQALEQFTTIVEDFPDSDLAPEANFHVGTADYERGEYEKAIAAYQKCVDSEADDSIREKAAYKLAWAHYKQQRFEDAETHFTQQIEMFPNGDLFADGIFMVAESQFRLKKHDQALESYLVAKPAIDKAGKIDPRIKLLAMLHGAQSANKTGKYSAALKLVTPVTEADVEESYQHDAWLQIGIAQEGLKNDEAAVQAWRIAEKNYGKTGARATCMIGDLLFRQKKFADAINEFKLVYYRFGKDAPDDIKPWQAYALYEAARCNFVQVANASGPQKSKYIADAIKHFENLLSDFGNDRLAPEAKKQLENLKKLQSN